MNEALFVFAAIAIKIVASLVSRYEKMENGKL